jgi:hypothetical protein
MARFNPNEKGITPDIFLDALFGQAISTPTYSVTHSAPVLSSAELMQQSQMLAEMAAKKAFEEKRKANFLKKMGEDADWEVGSVILFEKDFSRRDDGTTDPYTYSAIKFADNGWAITGMSAQSKKSWPELLNFILSSVNMYPVYYVTAIKELT